MNQTNQVKDKLAAGEPVLGIWSLVNSPMISELVGAAGLDFQILDMEHGVFDLPALDASVRASEAAGCSPLVRVPGLHPTTIQNVLDLGAHGLVVPQVQGYATVLDAVRAARFAPAGTRGFNPFTRAGRYAGGPLEGLPKLRDGFALTSIIVENPSAYEELDRILGIEGLDVVYLGSYDMSVHLGCMGQMDDPRITAFLGSAIPRIRRAGKAAGVMVRSQEETERMLELGANFIICGVDTALFSGAMRQGVAAFARARGTGSR